MNLFFPKEFLWFKKREKDVAVEELCRKFNAKLNFDLRTSVPLTYPDDSDSSTDCHDFTRERVTKNVRSFFNRLLILLWLTSVFCVAFYLVELMKNLKFSTSTLRQIFTNQTVNVFILKSFMGI